MILGFYARVSTEEQRERSTIDAQVEYARRRADLEGWELRVFQDDGVSGTVPLRDRPAGAELLRAAAAHELDVVATYRVDRLGRKLRIVLEAIDAIGIPYRSLTEPFDTATPLGRAMVGILGVFAELERDTFIERSRSGTDRVARLDGRWLGGIVPFGYMKRDDLTLAIDERPLAGAGVSQADVVREIFRRCAVEGWSTERIAVELNARHIPTAYVRDAREVLAGDVHGTRAKDGKRKRATAGTWSAGAVNRILRNEMYAGRHQYGRRSKAGRDLIERAMPAIVSPALFERARQQLAANAMWDRAHPKREYLLRGLLTCGCGHALIGQAYKGAGGREVKVYRCVAHPKDQGQSPRVFAAEAEAALWGDVVTFFENPDEVLRSIAHGAASAGATEDAAERELLRLAGELRDVDAQEDRLADAHARDLLGADAIARKMATLRSARTRIRKAMESLRAQRATAARAAEETVAVKRLLTTLAARARSADATVRAQVLRTLVKRTRVEWRGRRTLLHVVYAFAGEHEFAVIPRTDVDSEDLWKLDQVLEREHVLPAHSRWPARVEAGS